MHPRRATPDPHGGTPPAAMDPLLGMGAPLRAGASGLGTRGKLVRPGRSLSE
jgi:hypothetical protein